MSDLKLTDETKEAIIEMLTEIPNITAVAKMFRVNTSTIRKHRKSDPEFDQAVLDAIEDGYDMLEEEARRRAVDGVQEPIYYMGEKVGEVTKYSDQLLTLLLKGCKPKKFNGKEDGKEKDNFTLVLNMGGK